MRTPSTWICLPDGVPANRREDHVVTLERDHAERHACRFRILPLPVYGQRGPRALRLFPVHECFAEQDPHAEQADVELFRFSQIRDVESYMAESSYHRSLRVGLAHRPMLGGKGYCSRRWRRSLATTRNTVTPSCAATSEGG